MSHALIHYATVAEQAEMLRSKAVSPVELTRAYLDRIDHHDSRLRAYITVLSDSALRQAEEAGREIASGRYRGPLHGIPVALKDIIHVGGVPTTAGSRVMTGFVPREDSTIVRLLRGSGAVILGKANLSEFAMGGTVDHPYGTPRNPWNTSMTPGASSSGSGVAVAAGPLLRRAGVGHRRLDQGPRLLLRHRRPPSDVRPSHPSRRRADVLVDGYRRADGPER